MLRFTELNMFSMTSTIYRDLVCRANRGIYRLRGGRPCRYDVKATCMSKQIVTRLYWFWRPAAKDTFLTIIGGPSSSLASTQDPASQDPAGGQSLREIKDELLHHFKPMNSEAS